MSNLEIPANVSVNFQNREVRQQLVDDERFFFVVDVAGALTGQRQSARLPVYEKHRELESKTGKSIVADGKFLHRDRRR